LSTIILTLIIEIPILLIFNFRKKDIITIGILINVVTNFTINVIMYHLKYTVCPEYYGYWILPLEAAVIIIEFIAMSFFTDKKLKLFYVIVFANIVSYFSGVIIFGSY